MRNVQAMTLVAGLALMPACGSDQRFDNDSHTSNPSSRSLKSDAEDVAEDVSDAAGDAADSARDKSESAYDSVKDGMSDAYDATRDTTKNAYDKSKDSLGDAYDKSKDTLEAGYDKTKDAVSSVGDSAESVWESTRRKAGDFWQGTKDTAGSVWGSTKKKADSASDTVADKADQAADKASDAKNNAKDGIDDALPDSDELKSTVQDINAEGQNLSRGLRDRASDGIGASRDFASRQYNWAADKVWRARKQAEEDASAAGENVAQAAEDVKNEAEESVRTTDVTSREAGIAMLAEGACEGAAQFRTFGERGSRFESVEDCLSEYTGWYDDAYPVSRCGDEHAFNTGLLMDCRERFKASAKRNARFDARSLYTNTVCTARAICQ